MGIGIELAREKGAKKDKPFGMQLKWTTRTGGETPPDGDARLELYEVKGEGDTQTEDTLIATMEGTFAMADNKPTFTFKKRTVNMDTPQEQMIFIDAAPAAKTSDYFIALLESKGFEGMSHDPGTNLVKLPWRYAQSERSQFELAVRLKVKGKTYVDYAQASILDVPMAFEVPEDGEVAPAGKKPKRKLTHFGSGVVYPDDNELLGKSEKLVATGPLKIRLHESVKRTFKDLNTTTLEFDLPALAAHMKDVFDDVDLKVETTMIGDTEANKLGWTNKTTGTQKNRWVSKNLSKDPDVVFTTGVDPEDATSYPFFEYLVVYEDDLDSSPMGELAQAEVFAPRGEKVSIKDRTKRLVMPITIISKIWLKTAGEIQEPAQANTTKLLANVLSHEIGHSLGLRHALIHEDGKWKKAGGERGSMGAMSNFGVYNGQLNLKRFGPVHGRVIKQRFAGTVES